MRNPFRRAFTLVELLVVISIIALLISLLLPALQKARDSAAVAECQSTIKQICVALMLYEQDFGMFPVTVANRNHNSHGWAVNMQAVGNPNNTYWGGGGNCNTDSGYYINPYCNLPATHNNNTNPPEMFAMFKCPSDEGRFDNPYLPGCDPPWGDIPWTKFEWQGTSYEWNGMVQSYNVPHFREPLTFANGVTTASPSYWSQGLFWRGAHEIRDPSRQIMAGDPPMYPNYQELEKRGWAGCHDYMYNNHGPYEPVMNNGFVDGHVKFMHMKSFPDHFVNADYIFPPDGYNGRLK